MSVSTKTPLVYTSQTGVDSTDPTIVEHVASTTLRVNDAKYGLKTAAKIAHDKVARETFLAQKAEAIGRQRDREQAKRDERLAMLNNDITKISASLASGTSSSPEKAQTLLDTLIAKRDALASK